jgi:isoaspartyl peptidase/L-asparaginase-like protein (Ntn-hydrolase superfamily)
VVAAVTVMENSGMFNAASAVLQLDGVQRLDASLWKERPEKAVAGLKVSAIPSRHRDG